MAGLTTFQNQDIVTGLYQLYFAKMEHILNCMIQKTTGKSTLNYR